MPVCASLLSDSQARSVPNARGQVVERMRPLFARGHAILAGMRSGPKKGKSVVFDEDE